MRNVANTAVRDNGTSITDKAPIATASRLTLCSRASGGRPAGPARHEARARDLLFCAEEEPLDSCVDAGSLYQHAIIDIRLLCRHGGYSGG